MSGLNLETGIDSMTDFKRQTAEYLERLHKTGDPVVLTLNGRAQVVAQDAAAYQKLLEAAARSDREETVAASREGLDDIKAGRPKPARPALKALTKKFGIESTGDKRELPGAPDAKSRIGH
jgi:prevent-host-death family protein